MDPRYRFTIVVSFLLMGWWAYVVLTTFLFGERGLNVQRYGEGVLWVGLAALAGFTLIAAAAKLVAWQRKRQSTGFEAAPEDEFGTAFEMSDSAGNSSPFKIALSKFLPQLVAPPVWPGLTALETELLGFLNGYRQWPLDIANPETSLYEQAVARWQVMRHLPGAGPWHRVVALAKDLALVYAYQEVRTTYPLHEFWKRDRIKFVQRSRPHGGMTAFVLSTMPAFRALAGNAEGQAMQRSLLTALRYHENPTLLPVNAGSFARELVDYLWRADAQLRQLDVEKLDELTPARAEELKGAVTGHWLGVLAELRLQETPSDAMQALKQADGAVWVKLQALLEHVAPMLSPDMRQLLGLWDTQGGMHHPAWAHLANILLDAGLIANSHDGVGAVNGCFILRAGELTWGPAVKIVTDPAKHQPVLKVWDGLVGYKGPVDIALDLGQLTAMATTRARELEVKMGELF
ncbi:MAG: hypothetical protein GC129_01605 [Proteobacteria bacterium]|nr:hypothetical protein [Pseudomonadota bacterium]